MDTAKKRLFYLLIFLLVFCIDQLSKKIIRLSGGFYLCNHDLAFGLKIPPILFWFFWTAIITSIVWAFFRKKSALNKLPLLIIFSGAFSNLFDRLTLGCIVDFINIPFWPVLNLADCFISLGVIMLLFPKVRTSD